MCSIFEMTGFDTLFTKGDFFPVVVCPSQKIIACLVESFFGVQGQQNGYLSISWKLIIELYYIFDLDISD